MDGQRVHAAGKLAGERRIDHAVTFQAALAAERFRHDIQPEMSLAAGPVPGMALVPMRFVLDTQAHGRKGPAQLFRDEIPCSHVRSLRQTGAVGSMAATRGFAFCQVLQV